MDSIPLVLERMVHACGQDIDVHGQRVHGRVADKRLSKAVAHAGYWRRQIGAISQWPEVEVMASGDEIMSFLPMSVG